MKTIVIYKSKTGFTEMYAKAISEKLKCELLVYDEAKKRDLNGYDCIIYGAGIMAGRLYHIDKIKSLVHSDQKLIVFGTGATSQQAESVIESMKDDNLKLLDRTADFYYFEGGVNYEKMGFLPKKMLKHMYISLCKKTDKTQEEQGMMEALSKSQNHVNIDYIQPLIKSVKF